MNVTFRDVIFLSMFGFIVVIALMLAHINPPQTPPGETPPGNIIVQIEWPEGDNDVDLWVQAPGDRPVGYSNRSGLHFDLLRDDLGNHNDPGKANVEFAYARGQPDGHYIVNVHLFRGVGPVSVVCRIARRTSASTINLFTETVTLAHKGDEVTVMRFDLRDGQITDFTTLQKDIRSSLR